MVNAINACHIENDAPANENRIAPRETLESEIFIQQSGNKYAASRYPISPRADSE